MIVEMSGLGVLGCNDLTVSVEAVPNETFIAVLPILLEVQMPLNEKRSNVCIVTHTVAAHPRIA
jgi:hypothetical protein